MKVKESAKAELNLNIKKTKVMTTEEIHNVNIHNEDTEIVKDFAYPGSVNNSSADCSQEIKRWQRLRRNAMKNLRNIAKSKMCH